MLPVELRGIRARVTVTHASDRIGNTRVFNDFACILGLAIRMGCRTGLYLNLASTTRLALLAMGLSSALFAGQAGVASSDTSFEKTVQPFLAKNCQMCHNAKLKTAEIDFSQFKTDADAENGTETWEKAVDKLKAGSMPPQGLPRPKQPDIDVVVKWMEGAVARADDRAKPDPGRVTAHRLNRAEYNNTVRDLLGVDIRPADEFPQDDSGYGFDNNGDVLSISPVLMERYLTAADKVVRNALYGPENLKPTLVRKQPTSPKFEYFDRPQGDYDLTGLNMPNALHAEQWFPVEGDYTFRVALEGRRPAGSEPVNIGVWMDGKQIQTITIDAPSDGTASTCSACNASPGSRAAWRTLGSSLSVLHIYEGLPPSYGGPNPSKRPEPPPPDPAKKFAKIPPNATPEEEAKAIAAAEEKIKKNRGSGQPRVRALYRGDRALQREAWSLSAQPKADLCVRPRREAQRKLPEGHPGSTLQSRAFRRPVSAQELQPYLDLYAQARKQGV